MLQNFNYIYSIFFSLLLLNGFYNISVKSLELSSRILKIKDNFLLTIINFFVYINLISIITFNFSLYFGLNHNLLKFISILIILIGFYKPSYLIFIIKNFFKKKNFKINLIYLILLFYFLLTLSPISDPDTLDYHFTVPFYQMIFQDSIFPNYWLTSQLAGAGEALFSYGVSIGAIHFSQILQFFSLFILIIFILNFKTDYYKFSERKKIYVCLSILLIPAIIFLVTTSKPQIFPLVSNFFALMIALFYLPFKKKKNLITLYFLILFLIISSILFKFSFLLSASLISILAFYQLIIRKYYYELVLIPIILISFIILPREIFEFINLNSNIIYNFFNPVTDPYSSFDFNVSLKHGTGNNRLLPFWIFVPYPNISNITYCLGLSVLYFIFDFNLKKNLIKIISSISFTYIFLALIFAQPVGRFFLEPFIWLLFFSIFNFKKNKNISLIIFEKLLVFSSIIFLFIITYYSTYFLQGAYKKSNYIQLMNKHTDGYLLYQWANVEIPGEPVILSSHRSLSLYKSKAISYEFRLYSNSKTEEGFKYYINHIVMEKPKYILYTSHELNKQTDILKNCRGKLFKYKKNVGHTAGRNPFFDKMYYDGYIFKIDLKKLKNCKL